jgi:hypothetical protein
MQRTAMGRAVRSQLKQEAKKEEGKKKGPKEKSPEVTHMAGRRR